MTDYSEMPAEDLPDIEFSERRRWLFLGLPFTFTHYILKAKKLTVKTGLLSTTEDDVLLFRVMDTTLRRTLAQKLFGLGSIMVASSDQSRPELVIKNIKNCRQFKETLDQLIERDRLRMRFRTGEIVGDDDDCDFHHRG